MLRGTHVQNISTFQIVVFLDAAVDIQLPDPRRKPINIGLETFPLYDSLAANLATSKYSQERYIRASVYIILLGLQIKHKGRPRLHHIHINFSAKDAFNHLTIYSEMVFWDCPFIKILRVKVPEQELQIVLFIRLVRKGVNVLYF